MQTVIETASGCGMLCNQRRKTMPRHNRVEYIGNARHLVLVETYTRVCRLPNGLVLRHDGKDLWDTGRGGSWYGRPPADWDESLAVDEHHVKEWPPVYQPRRVGDFDDDC